MKKLLSLSLVASATILTLNAGATDLTEAIKGVDISGTATYRYNDVNVDNGASTTANNYKVAVSLKSKVNDDVAFNSRFLVESFGMDTSSGADGNVNVVLSEANFAYTGIANTSITVGKQGLATPFTVARDSMGDEQTGTGIIAASTVGPVTLVGAYFNQTNLSTVGDATTVVTNAGADIYVVGAVASVAGVNVDAFYADLADILDAYTIGLSASYKAGDVDLSPFARYSSLDLDTATTDNNLWKAGISASMGIFGAHLSYGETDKQGGTVGFDASSDTGFDEHWNVTLSGKADSDVLYAGVSAQVLPTLGLALNYSDMDRVGAADESEVYGQVTYDMSSNLSAFVRFGEYEVVGSPDQTAGRIQVSYTF